MARRESNAEAQALWQLFAWGSALLCTCASGCAGTKKAAGVPPGGDAQAEDAAGAVSDATIDDGEGRTPEASGRGVVDAEASPDAGTDAGTDAASEAGDAVDSGATGFTCPKGPYGAPIPAGATPTRIAGVPPSDTFNTSNGAYGIIEGPVWLGGSLYLSEINATPNPPASRILQVTAGAVSVALADSGSNGLAVDRSGNLYAAVHKDGSVSRVDRAAGTVTPIVSTYMGSRFDSPNDLTIRDDGNIYFSDPDYQAPTPAPQARTRLYRIAPGASTVTVVDDIEEPNGVTLSIDQNTLYVTYPVGLYKYPVAADGSVGAGTPLNAGITSGDGMAIDCAGNLYVANGTGLDVLDSTGKQIGQFTPTGIQSVTNAAFGGSDRKTLYLTALGQKTQKGLFSVTLAVPGMPY